MKINIQSSVALESKLVMQKLTKKVKDFAKSNKAIHEVDVKLRQDIVNGNRTSEIYLKMADKNIFTIQAGRTFDMATVKAITKLQDQLNKEGAEPAVAAQDAVQENNPGEPI